MGQLNYRPLIKWIIVLGIFFFLGKMIWGNWSAVKDAPFTIRPFFLIVSTLIFALSYFIQVWAWHVTTEKLGVAVSFFETSEGWFYSQLGKYLPGKIWLFLGRLRYYDSRGKSKKAVSVALYLEIVTVVMAAGLIFLISLILFREVRFFYSENPVLWLAIPILIAFLSIHPRVLERILSWILTRVGREPISLPISYFDVLQVLFISLLAWIVGGVGFCLFVDSVFPVSSHQILFLTGALAFSSMLGMVALFAPSGLGVREGALVYLLAFLMPASVAVVISILTRLWMTFIEIGLIGVVYLLSRFRNGMKSKKNVRI